MIATTTDSIPNQSILAILGVVQGNSVRAKHVVDDIKAELRGIVGGRGQEE